MLRVGQSDFPCALANSGPLHAEEIEIDTLVPIPQFENGNRVDSGTQKCIVGGKAI